MQGYRYFPCCTEKLSSLNPSFVEKCSLWMVFDALSKIQRGGGRLIVRTPFLSCESSASPSVCVWNPRCLSDGDHQSFRVLPQKKSYLVVTHANARPCHSSFDWARLWSVRFLLRCFWWALRASGHRRGVRQECLIATSYTLWVSASD